MDFSKHLKSEIDYSGLSYKELSQKSGVAERALYTYVATKNPSMPPADVTYKIARALGVSVEYLVTGGTEKSSHISAETRFVAETFDALSENDKKSVIALLKEMKSHR